MLKKLKRVSANLVRSLVRSSVRSSVHSSVRAFVRSFVRSFARNRSRIVAITSIREIKKERGCGEEKQERETLSGWIRSNTEISRGDLIKY